MDKSKEPMTRRVNQPAGKNWKRFAGFFLMTIVMMIGGSFIYFQSHFLPNTQFNGVKIGWLNVKEAKQKLDKTNTSEQVMIQFADEQEVITLPPKYDISLKNLQKQLGKSRIQLSVKSSFKEDLQNCLEGIQFPKGEASKDAFIQRENNQFKVVPEVYGSEIDRQAMIEQMIVDIEKGQSKKTYQAIDYYVKPSMTSADGQLAEKVEKLNKKADKVITVNINGQGYPFTVEELFASIDENGELNKAKIAEWVSQKNLELSSQSQSIQFTTIHGQIRSFKNDGSYGWGINQEQLSEQLIAAINSEQMQETLNAALVGDARENKQVSGTYVEIDLNAQKMYFFLNNEKVVDTDVITGRHHKGTATVPGFHTLLYKQTDTTLKGEMLDGTKYSVPVKYWMPLLSYGGVVTQIGIHDADYKSEHFGNKQAYKTNFGSNGCINTPGVAVAKIFENAYEGMPVIIYGNIYDDAPGEFDKPVDFGE